MDGEFKLEAIFDVCDENNQGYITIDRFKTLAKEHFGTDDTEVSCQCRSMIGMIHRSA